MMMQQPPLDHPERGSSSGRVSRSPLQRAWRAVWDHGAGSLTSFPELALFPTDEEGRQALRRVRLRMIFRRQFYLAWAVAAVSCLAITVLLRTVLSGIGLPISYTTLKLILVLPVMIPCVLLGIWVTNRHAQKMLRKELLDRGVPICVPCGYTLIGSPGPNCPECGKPLGARVQEILDTDAPA
ncbi:MAG: hypothetical protein GY715_17415 [Planctomycetes bacterium]|nr:hypothetical protein [Planctomycetota bacterium]